MARNRSSGGWAFLDARVEIGYPCYHKPCDTADKVNVAYLRAMTRLVATASGLLAVAEPGPSAG